MFRKGDALPLHAADKNNGVSLPTTNKSVLISVIWTVASLLFIVGGYWHCVNYKIVNTLVCENNQCLLTFKDVDMPTTTTKFTKSDLINAEVIRIEKGEKKDANAKKRHGGKSLGYSIELTYKAPAEENSRIKIQKEVILCKTNLGRRSAKDTASDIIKFRDGKGDKTLNVSLGRSYTVGGLCAIFVGVCSFIVSLLAGQFSEQSAKRMRKVQ